MDLSIIIAILIAGLAAQWILVTLWLSGDDRRREDIMTPKDYKIALQLGELGFVESVRLELAGVITATTAKNAAAQLAEAARIAIWAAERLRGFERGGTR